MRIWRISLDIVCSNIWFLLKKVLIFNFNLIATQFYFKLIILIIFHKRPLQVLVLQITRLKIIIYILILNNVPAFILFVIT